MTISEDWLLCPTTLAEVDDRLGERNVPDLWLRAWRTMLDRMEAGDELWEYGATE